MKQQIQIDVQQLRRLVHERNELFQACQRALAVLQVGNTDDDIMFLEHIIAKYS